MPKTIIQTERDRSTYIPPAVRDVMNQNVNAHMPAHLKNYLNNSSGYIPPGMQAQLTKQLNRNLPSHLKNYTDAYVQQSFVAPALQQHGGAGSAVFNQPPKVPDPLRLGHSMPGEQHSVDLNAPHNQEGKLFSSDNQPSPEPSSGNPNYDFILNPPVKNSGSKLPGFGGLSPRITKALLGIILAFFVIILIKILAGAFSAPSNKQYLVSVLQDQQEILHLIKTASSNSTSAYSNQNFITTASLTVNSSQKDLLHYMALNHLKFNSKVLFLKQSLTLDQTINSSLTSGNYQSTLTQAFSDQLKTYKSDLDTAYGKTSGKKGKALLVSDYKQAKLLLSMLNQAGG